MGVIGELSRRVDCDSLPHAQRAYMLVRTIRSDKAIQDLTTIAAAALPTGVHSRRGIEKMVRIHFGWSISFVSVRKDMRTTHKVTMAHFHCVRNALAKIRFDLIQSLEKLAKKR